MRVDITLHVPDPMMAILQAKALVAQLEAGNSDGSGQGVGHSFWEMYSMPDDKEHGDYRDGEGNLVHVVNDHIINCTWAKQNALQTDPGVHYIEWENLHGKLELVSAHADDEDGDEQQGGIGHDHGN